MFILQPSQSQALSADYLRLLGATPAMEITYFSASRWLLSHAIAGMEMQPHQQSVTAVKPAYHLLVLAQGLNLEKLQQVQQAFAGVLRFGAGRFKSLSDKDHGVALEFAVELIQQQGLTQLLEQTALALQLELVLLGQRPRLSEPGLLLMDMDSTVIAVECIDEMATLAGVGEQVSQVTELAMQGELAFADSLINRVACLAGADEAIIAKVRDALPLMPGLERLLAVLKQHNWKVAIASGGFTYFAHYLQQRLGLDAAIANELEFTEGKLSGKVKGKIVDAQVKADTIQQLAQQWQIPASQTVAMGDGANDLLMMQQAGLGVAFHAKPVVRQQADAAIRFSGLDSLLYMLQD